MKPLDNLRSDRGKDRRAIRAREEIAARRSYVEEILAQVHGKACKLENRLRETQHPGVRQRLLVQLQAVEALRLCLEDYHGDLSGAEAVAIARVHATAA